MIDQDLLLEKINSIQNCLKRINDTLQGDFTKLDQLDAQDIIILNLQRAIQLVIDMASHIVSAEKLGLPHTLKELFSILQKNNIIPIELSNKMQKMVGFRNIAVHTYQMIDPSILKSILALHLQDFEKFYRLILLFAQNKSGL